MNAGRRRLLAAVAGAGAPGLAGCSLSRSSTGSERIRTGTPTPEPTSPTPPVKSPRAATGYRYTSLAPGGNRVVVGTLDLGSADPVDLPLDADPAWIVARPEPDGSGADWAVVTEGGTVSAFGIRRGETAALDVTPSTADPETPPVLRSSGPVRLLSAPADASALSHPLPMGDDGLFYVRPDGTVVRQREGARSALKVDALPDARPRLVDEKRIALLAGATDRYGHGALGDSIEAGRLVVVDVSGTDLRVAGEVRLDSTVIEGLAPLVDGPSHTASEGPVRPVRR